MENFSKILNWFIGNFWKIILLFATISLSFFLIKLLMPFFYFVSFLTDSFEEIKNIFNTIEKDLNEFQWEKTDPKNKEGENV